jgi:hypothetical protein
VESLALSVQAPVNQLIYDGLLLCSIAGSGDAAGVDDSAGDESLHAQDQGHGADIIRTRNMQTFLGRLKPGIAYPPPAMLSAKTKFSHRSARPTLTGAGAQQALTNAARRRPGSSIPTTAHQHRGDSEVLLNDAGA